MAYTNFRAYDLAGVDLYSIDTAKKFPLGTVVKAIDPTYGPGEFIYLQGVASTVEGDVVTFYEDAFTTARLAANAIGQVAVALGACVANRYGWYQITGKAIVKAGTVADNGLVYATATAGTVDDAVVAGDRVKKAIFASADGTPAAGFAECEIQYPFMDDGSAA